MSVAESLDDQSIMMFCASCGIKEDDDIKLKTCNACYLVRYCGSKCQRDHWPKHKRECKKRAAELRDEILFKQPESSHMGDCPICCLPLPIYKEKSPNLTCCGKKICYGCHYAHSRRTYDERLEETCPFCRQTPPKTQEEAERNIQKRIEANDPSALSRIGTKCIREGDDKGAFECFTKVAALGDIGAHYQLSCLYKLGKGVEKDDKKSLYHSEQAAIGGHVKARHNLGFEAYMNGKMDRAVKHWIIAAKLGHDDSLQRLKNGFQMGTVSKDVFAAALRAHKAAVDAMKSPQREEAERVWADAEALGIASPFGYSS